jgi:hypothetical protein
MVEPRFVYGVPKDVAHCRSFSITAYREAVLAMSGKSGLEDVLSRMPLTTRLATDGTTPAPQWIPVGYVIDWCSAIWEGPSRRERALYNAFIHKQVALGFGRIERLILKTVSPQTLVQRGPGLWSKQHTHGELTVALPEPKQAILRLSDHPYADMPQARATLAEVFRHLITLTGEKEVTESHRMIVEGNVRVLVVRLDWSGRRASQLPPPA